MSSYKQLCTRNTHTDAFPLLPFPTKSMIHLSEETAGSTKTSVGGSRGIIYVERVVDVFGT